MKWAFKKKSFAENGVLFQKYSPTLMFSHFSQFLSHLEVSDQQLPVSDTNNLRTHKLGFPSDLTSDYPDQFDGM